MLDLAELLHKWAVEEMGFRLMGQHAGSRMPDPSDLQELCRGGNAEIWNYVLRHVWSLQTVRQVKGNIMLKHAQLKQTLTFEEGKSQEDVVDDRSKLESERFLLMQELLKAESKKQHLEKSLDHLLNDMINSDRKVTTARDKVKELQHTLALRELFTASVVEKSQGFLQLRNQLDCILEALKESSRYNLQEPRDGLKSDLETTASKELQEITKAIQKFLHRLSMGDFTNDRVLLHSVKMDLWQSVRKLVKYYPKRRLLTNLIAHAQEAIISVNHLIEDVDVLKDARKLKYQQSGVITRKDVTNSYNLHQTVGQLLETGREAHIQGFIETKRHQQNIAKLEKQVLNLERTVDSVLMNTKCAWGSEDIHQVKLLIQAEAELAAKKEYLSAINKSVSELESKAVELSQKKEELMLKFVQIQSFQRTVETKQQLIKLLLKQSLEAENRSQKQQKQIQEFIEDTLFTGKPLIEEKVNQLDGWVGKEMNLFQSVTLPHLLTISLQNSQRVPMVDLTINRFHHEVGHCNHQDKKRVMVALDCPTFLGMDLLLKKAILLKSGIAKKKAKCNSQVLLLNKMNLQKSTSDYILSDVPQQVEANDKKLIKKLLPVVLARITAANRGISECSTIQERLHDWWEQPGQFALPSNVVEGRTLQQWLHLWTVAASKLNKVSSGKE